MKNNKEELMEENKNLEIEQLRQQLKQQEKLASLGTLSAGIAHEIQNPLNFVINFSKMSDKLLSDLSDIVADNEDKLSADDREELDDIVADLQENMQKIVEHGERAISIIRGILLISRGKEGERIPTNIAQMVKEYVWLSYHAMRANQKGFNITIHEHYQESMPLVSIIPQELSRAVLNVMNNAFYAVWDKAQTATDYSPEVDISVSLQDDKCTIAIADNGEGMNSEVQQRLFENFFTTKPAGKGTGLGMGITREIVEQHHQGRLTVDSTVGEGTTITFIIPVKA